MRPKTKVKSVVYIDDGWVDWENVIDGYAM